MSNNRRKGCSDDALVLARSVGTSRIVGLTTELRFANLLSRISLVNDQIEDAVEYRDLELKLCARGFGRYSLDYALALKHASVFYKDCGRLDAGLICGRDAISILEQKGDGYQADIQFLMDEFEELAFSSTEAIEMTPSSPPAAIAAENNPSDATLECLVCMDQIFSHFGFLHKGSLHSNFCENCANTLKHKKCPICNQPVEQIIRIF